jgi:hypothetical protein
LQIRAILYENYFINPSDRVLTNDANNGNLTVEKVATKGAMMAIPAGVNAAFKSSGASGAQVLLNLQTMAVDKSLDVMRETKSGSYKK